MREAGKRCLPVPRPVAVVGMVGSARVNVLCAELPCLLRGEALGELIIPCGHAGDIARQPPHKIPHRQIAPAGCEHRLDGCLVAKADRLADQRDAPVFLPVDVGALRNEPRGELSIAPADRERELAAGIGITLIEFRDSLFLFAPCGDQRPGGRVRARYGSLRASAMNFSNSSFGLAMVGRPVVCRDQEDDTLCMAKDCVSPSPIVPADIPARYELFDSILVVMG